MQDTIATFAVSTDEDFRFQIDFTNLDLTGKTLKVNVRRRDTGALVQALVAPTHLTLVGAGNLTVAYPRASMGSWARTEYQADILDETSGNATRIMAVRVVYDAPGRLAYGVRGNQATVEWGETRAVVTAIGGVGPPGPANALTIGDVTAVAFGEPAAVRINGAAPTQELEFDLPMGAQGPSGTIEIASVTTGAPGTDVEIVNSGTPEAAELDITVPKGDTGDQGEKGWSPVFAVATYLGRRVLELVDWVGGEGTKPATGDYVGETGLEADIADAVNIRGDQGPPGSVADGDKVDITVEDGGTSWLINDGAVDYAALATVAEDRSQADFRITDLGDAMADTDALNRQTGDARYGVWTVLEEQAVSGSPASVAFTELTGGLEHRLLISNIRPASDDRSLILQVQTGGSTWQTSGYVYSGRLQGPGGGADTGSTIDGYGAGILLTRINSGNGVGNETGEGVDGEVSFTPGNTSARRRFRSSVVFTRSDGAECLVSLAGAYGTNAAITGVRLIWGSGNFANVGSVTLLRRLA